MLPTLQVFKLAMTIATPRSFLRIASAALATCNTRLVERWWERTIADIDPDPDPDSDSDADADRESDADVDAHTAHEHERNHGGDGPVVRAAVGGGGGGSSGGQKRPRDERGSAADATAAAAGGGGSGPGGGGDGRSEERRRAAMDWKAYIGSAALADSTDITGHDLDPDRTEVRGPASGAPRPCPLVPLLPIQMPNSASASAAFCHTIHAGIIADLEATVTKVLSLNASTDIQGHDHLDVYEWTVALTQLRILTVELMHDGRGGAVARVGNAGGDDGHRDGDNDDNEGEGGREGGRDGGALSSSSSSSSSAAAAAAAASTTTRTTIPAMSMSGQAKVREELLSELLPRAPTATHSPSPPPRPRARVPDETGFILVQTS